MNPGEATVSIITPEAVPLEMGMQYLTAEEIDRASRFRFAKDATHWISCRAQLRMILGRETGLPPREVPLILSEFGKPLLAAPHAGLHFNLTHSAELALLAVTRDGPVGIDLENECRGLELGGCETIFCHPWEIRNLPSEPALRTRRLLKIWTSKEAVLKALGTGLSFPPEKLRILGAAPTSQVISDTPLPGLERQCLQELAHPLLLDCQAMISTPSSVMRITLLDSAME